VYHQPTASSFRAQIRAISDRFDFVDVDAAVRRLEGDPAGIGARAFALVTFDDGLRDVLGVMDELVRREIRACLYITTEYLGGTGYLQPSEVRALSETFDIGSHTISHQKLLLLDERQLTSELEGSRHFLEDLTGRKVVHFAAPFGGPSSFGPTAIRAVKEAGYETFRTTFRGWNRSSLRRDFGLHLLRADVIEDWYPSWRLRATLAGALDWRATVRLHRALAG
jgi:peptidoglycan/xylan/chitin deacetylase (PgdA/CDA1 family)